MEGGGLEECVGKEGGVELEKWEEWKEQVKGGGLDEGVEGEK